MWIKFNTAGMKWKLRIVGYKPSEEGDHFCHVDFSFVFEGCIRYVKSSQSILENYEVETLEWKIDRLLSGEMLKQESFMCVEPDFGFEFYPSYDQRENPSCIYVKPGHEMTPIFMDFQVYLSYEGIATGNYFSTSLDREEMKIFRDYLRLIMGKTDRNNEEIQRYMRMGYIFE